MPFTWQDKRVQNCGEIKPVEATDIHVVKKKEDVHHRADSC